MNCSGLGYPHPRNFVIRFVKISDHSDHGWEWGGELEALIFLDSYTPDVQ